ncbi:MAG: phosphoribosyltransferase [Gammaproteobacteria bacterium]|nr:phosphoribosyltransferase [Gammaproteobacteria bacterium]
MQTTDSPQREAREVPCELVTWEQSYQLARKLACQVREDGFAAEIIVAISRGGLIPARVLSDHLNLFDLATLKIEHYHAAHKEGIARVKYPLTAEIEGRRVLLVDDVSDSGDTFQVAVQHLFEQGEPASLRTAVLHHKRVSRYVPDYFSQEVTEWRWLIYPWAVMEDLSSFLQEIAPRPKTVGAFASSLQTRHAIEVPRQTLEDVLAMTE